MCIYIYVDRFTVLVNPRHAGSDLSIHIMFGARRSRNTLHTRLLCRTGCVISVIPLWHAPPGPRWSEECVFPRWGSCSHTPARPAAGHWEPIERLRHTGERWCPGLSARYTPSPCTQKRTEGSQTVFKHGGEKETCREREREKKRERQWKRETEWQRDRMCLCCAYMEIVNNEWINEGMRKKWRTRKTERMSEKQTE